MNAAAPFTTETTNEPQTRRERSPVKHERPGPTGRRCSRKKMS